MTECQGCGAWNDSSRTLCVLCGTPLAETDEWDTAADLPPLPPLPDGGLSVSMPAWLRERPGGAADTLPASTVAPVASVAPAPLPALPVAPVGAIAAATLAGLPPLGATADPRTFLTDDDFSPWLRELAAREGAVRAAPRPALPSAPAPLRSDGLDTGPGQPLPAVPDALVEAATPAPPTESLPAAAMVAARAHEERRQRAPWETLLLVILFIGVVVAALWALVSNGVLSPSL